MSAIHKFISKGDRKSRGAGKPAGAAAVGRAVAHLKYIQHRPGRDREEGGREFFDDEGKEVTGKEVREAVKKMEKAKVVIHTLTLSPEINLVDQEHNEALNNGCEMLLGADGTLVCPEIPFALQNLRLGGDWLDKSLKAASTGQLRTSRLYMRGTAKAIDRATRLIDKKVKPNRRTAVLKIPSYLKAADREENLEKKL
jgi:hypothetical protein